MTESKAYKDLIGRVRTWLFDLPDSDLLMPLMEMRFTPEEAKFLSMFPYLPNTMEQLTQRFGIPAEDLERTMEPMIRKGFICAFEGKNAMRYSFMDPIFFFCRMPGWTGKEDEWNKKIAPLINRYYIEDLGPAFFAHPTKGLRTIPIAKTIQDPRTILPYEDVLELVDQEDYYAVSTCACRHRHALDPDFASCRHEKDVCLHFGKLGKYSVDYGMGRKITREETLEILENAADAGLVHGISNTKSGMDTICNCCSCCCLFLEPVKMPHPMPGKHQRSNYLVQVNRETCQACGLCQKRCPVGAIELKEKRNAAKSQPGEKLKPKDTKEIVYQSEQCIGCGVCVHKCPTQSLTLVRREKEEDIPESMSDLGRRMLKERRRDMSKIF